MRYNKAHGATLRMLMDEAIPRRPDGALNLCATCQRHIWLLGGYVSALAGHLASLGRTLAHLERMFLPRLKELGVGDTCGIVTHDRERAVDMAKSVADEREWKILIQRRGYNYVKITRQERGDEV